MRTLSLASVIAFTALCAACAYAQPIPVESDDLAPLSSVTSSTASMAQPANTPDVATLAPAAGDETAADTSADTSADISVAAPTTTAADDDTAAPAEEDASTVAIPATQPVSATVAKPRLPAIQPVYADILVSNVTVTVPNSTGLERDKALDLASRQAMPLALAQMNPPVTGAKAQVFISNQGDLTRYIKTVRIIKEVLVPDYTLTATLTFDAKKLYANLGGYVPTALADPSGTQPVGNNLSDTDNRPYQSYTLQITSGNPSDQTRLYQLLGQLPDSKTTYSSFTTQDATYTVKTRMSSDELTQALTAKSLTVLPADVPGGTLRVSF